MIVNSGPWGDIADLLAVREVTAEGCWLWTGQDKYGYGHLRREGRPWLVHRLAYTLWVGEIPKGLVIDHTCHSRSIGCVGGMKCRHRRCFNPDHLEVVTRSVNSRRGRPGKISTESRRRAVKPGSRVRTFWLDDELVATLDRFAVELGVDRAFLVRDALSRHIEHLQGLSDLHIDP